MAEVRIADDLWASTMSPQGTVERWLVEDGAAVRAGQALVQVRVEDALHDIAAPVRGQLHILVPTNGIVEPGKILAQVAP